MKMMEGKKTYTGIGLIVIGALMKILGVDEATAQETMNMALSLISDALELVGVVLGLYGARVSKAVK